AALRHHRRTQFKDARIAGSRGDQVDDHARIEASLHAEHQGFGGSYIVDGNEKIRDVFHSAAVAEWPDIEDPAAKCREQWPDLRNKLRVAAGIEKKVEFFFLRAGAAHRAVDHLVTGLTHDRGRFFLI